jgi:site-specific DNA recombinase
MARAVQKGLHQLRRNVALETPQHDGRCGCRPATLVAAIARGRRWLDELTTDPSITTESIAKREDCSIRKVNMTISLAFLAPDLVKAAVDGRLPHGMGVARLTDLPPEWSRQHELLHLPSY